MNYHFGPKFGPSGSSFRLWGPGAESVELQLYDEKAKPSGPRVGMDRQSDGWWVSEAVDPAEGQLYHFCINGELCVPDPASRFQPFDVHGPSMIVDPRSASPNTRGVWKGRPWEEVALYELHLGTFTPEGTYAGAEKKLRHLAELGITAVELMPLSDFSGRRNWGYDGVLPFAPDSSYGTHSELRSFISSAHDAGLMVFLDVVYNHFGPEGNYLHLYAPSFFTDRFDTPWGAAIDFTQEAVRRFFIENAVYWLNDVGFDGLRLDAVHAIEDPSGRHILAELCDTVRSEVDSTRHVHLVLENDANQSRFLGDKPGELYDAQWNDDAHHVFHVIATGECDGYYQDYCEESAPKIVRSLTEGFVYQGEPSKYRDGEPRGEPSAHLRSSAFVSFLQNHDQIGNRPFGNRLTTLVGAGDEASGATNEPLVALQTLLLLSPHVPMLFMGEEWGSTTPFYYFCDYEAELGQAVTEGRRREFAGFAGFQDEEARKRIPDPNAPETFEASILKWDELERPEERTWLKRVQRLLQLRRDHIVPFIKAGTQSDGAGAGTGQNLPDGSETSAQSRSYRGESPEPGLVLARWEHGEKVLTLVANLSSEKKEMLRREAFLGGDSAASRAAVLHAVGEHTESDSGIRLGPWSVSWRLF